MKRIVVAAVALLAAACGGASDNNAAISPSPEPEAEIPVAGVDVVAEKFVKLALAFGEHDPAYVDAYHGPAEWAEAATAEKRDLAALRADAGEILDALDGLRRDGVTAREAALQRQTVAALTRIRMASGEKFTFNEEAKLLYGVSPPDYSTEAFDAALAEIDALFPGPGALPERVDAFRNTLAIPADKRQAVFEAAIAECRRRTLAHYDLPPAERFSMNFVANKPWSGYNWYKGEFESLIEINTDQPIIIDRATDLGCHEGYPGHHVWNLMVERDLRDANGWIEFSILPLFSPQALVGEGSANYGIRLAFPAGEKTAFERTVLFPLAGLDPADADKLAALNDAQRKLSHAGNYVAREYLDGGIEAGQAIDLLMKYQLFSRSRAEQRLKFIETYRSYVINYNIGLDLVEAYVEREKARGADPWVAFEALLKNPDALSILAPA